MITRGTGGESESCCAVKRSANGFVANFGIVLETACETFVSQLSVKICCTFGYLSQRSRTELSSRKWDL